MAKLPDSVRASYREVISHVEVARIFELNHYFLFPTRGENFGHVILEALTSGCPVILSDQTPWRGLEEQGIGWDVPLDIPERFAAVLQQCLEMGADEFAKLSERASNAGFAASANGDGLRANRVMFESVSLAAE